MTVTTIAFSGLDSSGHRDLVLDDGTTINVLTPANTFATSTGLAPSAIVSYLNGTALFSGKDTAGARDIWVTNGSSAGTHAISVTGAAPAGTGLSPTLLTNFNGLIYFSGLNSAGQRALWQTDGTTAGTVQVTVPAAKSTGTGLAATSLVVSGSNLFILGSDSSSNPAMWVSNGTTVTQIAPPSGAVDSTWNPHTLLPFGAGVLFNATPNGGSTALWFTDGSTTTEITNAGQSTGNGLNPSGGATLANGKEVFGGIASDGSNSIYVTDGTSIGTAALTPASIGPSGNGGLGPSFFFGFGGAVYFEGTNSSSNPGLWKSDGTSGGTVQVAVTGASSTIFSPRNFISQGGFMYFTGDDSTGTNTLWKSDGTTSGTTEISNVGTFNPTIDAAVTLLLCYAAGTRIAAEVGEVAVEDLRRGDRVRSHLSGLLVPVTWVGRRSVDCARQADPRKVWPVRIGIGAFGPNRPHRALYVSPDHAVYVDNVLIPIRLLINHRSIAQVPVETITYYHLELASHDVLMAEGLPAESYLDTGDRANFDNGGGGLARHPDFAAAPPHHASVWETLGCAPLVVVGPVLEAVCRRLTAIDRRWPDRAGPPGRVRAPELSFRARAAGPRAGRPAG